MAAKGQAYWPLESEILFLKNKHLTLANADQVAAEIVELGAVGRKSRKGSLGSQYFSSNAQASSADRCYANGVRLRLAGLSLEARRTSRLFRPVSFHLTSDLSIKAKCATPRFFIWTSCEG
jgi:hypothetical protein